MTATLTTPKRWPINPDIIDSPACAMPQYAGYRRHFYLVSGSYLEVSGKSAREVLAKGVPFAREDSRIVRIPVNHKGTPVGSAPWAGGTWSGLCGASLWVHDHDRSYQDAFRVLYGLGGSSRMQDFHSSANHGVDTSQAWWVNGVADKHPEIDGFWIECRNKMRHLGPCTGLDITWNWRDYAPYTDQGHNTQLSLF